MEHILKLIKKDDKYYRNKINDTNNIKFQRIWSMPNKNTFEILPIKKLLLEEVDLKNFWIDPFC